MVAIVEGFHHHSIGLRGQPGDLAGFGGVGGERLFTQHVFTGGQRGSGPLAVQPVWQRVVDGVEIRVGDQRGVVVVHPGDAVLGSESSGTRAIACGHRGDHDLGVVLGGFDQRHRCDRSGAQDADPQVFSHGPDATDGRRPGRARV